jgi:hypothetical protein
MKKYGGVNVWIHIFLTSALVGDEWSASRPCRFTPGERARGTHWIGGWVDRKAGLDDVEKRIFWILPGLELRNIYSKIITSLFCVTEENILFITDTNRFHLHNFPIYSVVMEITN